MLGSVGGEELKAASGEQQTKRGERAVAGDQEMGRGGDGRGKFVDGGRDLEAFIGIDAAVEIKGEAEGGVAVERKGGDRRRAGLVGSAAVRSAG